MHFFFFLNVCVKTFFTKQTLNPTLARDTLSEQADLCPLAFTFSDHKSNRRPSEQECGYREAPGIMAAENMRWAKEGKTAP